MVGAGVPELGLVVPLAMFDLVVGLDEAVCSEFLGDIFEILLNFTTGCVKIGPVWVWGEGVLV